MNLVNFYLGLEPDYQGRMLEEIWRWDLERLEEVHDYIQVLFPLAEPSLFSSRAPILREQETLEFRSNDTLRKNLLRSFHLMLEFFYGLERRENPLRIEKAASFCKRASTWIILANHNHLRITRILKCLQICGLGKQAEALLECLLDVQKEFPHDITEDSLAYWKGAVAGAQTQSS